MMIHKKVWLVFFVVAVVILAGCGPKNPSSSTTPFCGGFDGIEMNFMEGSPPTEVFDNGQFPFDVTLRLLNKGEHAVGASEARIELSGINSVDFGGPAYTKVVNENIVGTRKDQDGKCVNGDPILVSFGGAGEEQFKYKNSLPGNTQFLLRADICYRYNSNSTVQFCVQKELPRFGQEPTCKVDELKTVSNSGSPLHIENFKQNPAGEGKIGFSFDIVHKGTGSVHYGTLCDSSFQARNKVRVKVDSRIGRVSCSPLGGGSEGVIMITENKRPVSCVMDVSGASGREFETPVNIEMDFNYKQHEDINILVKHLG